MVSLKPMYGLSEVYVWSFFFSLSPVRDTLRMMPVFFIFFTYFILFYFLFVQSVQLTAPRHSTLSPKNYVTNEIFISHPGHHDLLPNSALILSLYVLRDSSIKLFLRVSSENKF